MVAVDLNHKPPLQKEALRDVIDLSLWAGQLLLQNGAPSQTVEETVHRMGTGLGADWMDVVVLTGAIVLTTHSGNEFRTKTRRVVRIGVNMQVINDINDLSRRICSQGLDRTTIRSELRQISDAPRNYSHWLTVILVGLACAAFSRLFGGDLAVFVITFAAAALAQTVREELLKHDFNPLLVVTATAFVAGLCAYLATYFSPSPEDALASAVLLVVPGVPLINAAEDLIEGHLTMGIVRGIYGAIVSLALALGLLLAMQLTGAGL